SPSGLIYAHSWYLDHMAENWDALVMGDYEAVMPLTWKRKFGFSYLYQPFLTAQLGVFSHGNRTVSNEELVNLFINMIPRHFRLIEINLNDQNEFNKDDKRFQSHANFTLNLDRSYSTL